MDAFLDTGIWQMGDLIILNRVRRYKYVFSKSDILQPDGRTVLPSMMDKTPGNSEWTFPKEKPTQKQLNLWYAALQHLTSTDLQLCRPMGNYINPPHKKTGWYLSNSNTYLYNKCENGAFDTFRRAPDSRSSRRPKYVGCIPSSIPPLNPTHHKYAAVKVNSSAGTVSILSSGQAFQPTVQVKRPVPDILRSWPNPGLWNDLECDDDGWWILDALKNETLYLVSDGSYQREVDPEVCSCAFTAECKATGKKLVCTWVERSPSASNYRGEILGALGYTLVMKAVLDYESAQSPEPLILPKGPAFCDNMGVIKHGSVPNKPLSEKQVQADLFGHMKYLLRNLPINTAFTHIQGHMDEVLELPDMTYEQILQVQMGNCIPYLVKSGKRAR